VHEDGGVGADLVHEARLDGARRREHIEQGCEGGRTHGLDMGRLGAAEEVLDGGIGGEVRQGIQDDRSGGVGERNGARTPFHIGKPDAITEPVFAGVRFGLGDRDEVALEAIHAVFGLLERILDGLDLALAIGGGPLLGRAVVGGAAAFDLQQEDPELRMSDDEVDLAIQEAAVRQFVEQGVLWMTE
jgi:hypothetical protein